MNFFEFKQQQDCLSSKTTSEFWHRFNKGNWVIKSKVLVHTAALILR
jgi:hypothetical protein